MAYQLNGHGFECTPGVGDGQGGLASCGPRDGKESATTEWLNNNYRRGRMSFQGPWGNGGKDVGGVLEHRFSLRYCGDENHPDKKPCWLRAP